MDGKDEKGRFLPGNRIWEAGAKIKPKFETAEALWDAAVEYFEWVEANPLFEAKAFAYEGRVTVEPLPKMRAMSKRGLCLFLGISEQSWYGWQKKDHELYKPHLVEIIARVEAVIVEQKFTGAAAELLNPSIISRDLGLADKSEITGAEGGPIKTEEVGSGAAKLAEFLNGIAERSGTAGSSDA